MHMFMSLSQSVKDVMGKNMEGNVKNLEDKMKEGYKNLEEKMCVKIETGFKNEENARQNEIAVMKEEIKNIKMGSSSAARSEASTGAALGSGTFYRPSLLATRWSDTWVPGKLEFKEWNPDFTKRNIQGIPDSQEKTVLDDLEKMMPHEVRKWLNWEQTRNEQGTWPRTTILSLWFIHDTGWMMMIEILKMMRDDLSKTQFRVNGKRVRTNQEMSPKETSGTSSDVVLQRPQGSRRR